MTRRTWSLVVASAIVAIVLPKVIDLPKVLLWNPSPSAPIGLYHLRPTGTLQVADLVVVDLPEPLARFVIGRGYLPAGIPLVKRVVGLPGQTVCRIHHAITIDGVEIGAALETDRLGRPMPVWQGCRRIAADEVFLMNQDVENSLDGRYFGPIPVSSIRGAAVPVWTSSERIGRERWRVNTDRTSH
jgi:conjugative transfer signal peptidase TraF